LRPRRLRDASKVDMRTDLFGTVFNSPIFTCPAPGEKISSSGWRTLSSARHQMMFYNRAGSR
jgi:isopentenyl diphosphate isomerase/L-lactate dehydrogenase-like FMN-dependent dehydrogenase